MTLPIYKDSVTVVHLRETTEETTGEFANTASGTWKLLSADGVTTIESGSLTYVADSDGHYQALVPGSSVVIDTDYIFEANFNSGQSKPRVPAKGQWYQGDG